MTAALFGSIIHHQLVTSVSLMIALKLILEALQQPRHTNMFKFGVDALQQIKSDLVAWPDYLRLLATHVPHLREVDPQVGVPRINQTFGFEI